MFVQHDLDIFLLLRTSCSDLYIPLFIGLFAFMIICLMHYLRSLFRICIPEKIFVHFMFIVHTPLTFPFEMFRLVCLFLYVCHLLNSWVYRGLFSKFFEFFSVSISNRHCPCFLLILPAFEASLWVCLFLFFNHFGVYFMGMIGMYLFHSLTLGHMLS